MFLVIGKKIKFSILKTIYQYYNRSNDYNILNQ